MIFSISSKKKWDLNKSQAVYVLLQCDFSWVENLLVFINLLTHLKPIFQSKADKLEEA